MEILGTTFSSGLVEHSMSCSLWTEETSGWVTTMCPGSAKFYMGISGKKTSLHNVTSNRASIPAYSVKTLAF